MSMLWAGNLKNFKKKRLLIKNILLCNRIIFCQHCNLFSSYDVSNFATCCCSLFFRNFHRRLTSNFMHARKKWTHVTCDHGLATTVDVRTKVKSRFRQGVFTIIEYPLQNVRLLNFREEYVNLSRSHLCDKVKTTKVRTSYFLSNFFSFFFFSKYLWLTTCLYISFLI